MTVKELRIKKHISQLELSKQCEVSIQQIQKIEQGKILLRSVKYSTVECLYYLLRPEGVNIHDFVFWNDWDVVWSDNYEKRR